MAKLAISPSSQEKRASRLRKLEQSSQSCVQQTPACVKKEASRSTPKYTEYAESQCIGECGAKSKKWLEENTRLSATITQLRHDMAEQEAELEKLRSEKKTLQEENLEICDINEGLCDTKRSLCDENEKLKEGYEEMREKYEALQRSVVELQPTQSSCSDYEVKLEEIGNALKFGLTHVLNVIQDNKPKGPGSTEKLLELPQNDEISARPVSCIPESTTETQKDGAGNAKSKLETLDTGSSKPLSDTLNAIKRENIQEKTVDSVSKASEHESQETEVKMESEEPRAYYKFVPGNFDSAINIDDEEERPRKSKSKRFYDSLDDITFFSKPPAGAQKSKLNDRLSRVFSSKPASRDVQVKSEPAKAKSEEKSSKVSVKREFHDENSNREIKQEPSKRRKALAPVSGLANRRALGDTSKAKKGSDKAFDFVEKPVLIEQSRLANQTSL